MLNITITVMMSVAIALLVIITAMTQKRLNQIDDTIDEINEQVSEDGATTFATKVFTEKKIDEFDRELKQRTTDYYDQMAPVFDLLEYIIKDIQRLDETTYRDHRDLVDIRQRYVLYKGPISEQEDQTDGND